MKQEDDEYKEESRVVGKVESSDTLSSRSKCRSKWHSDMLDTAKLEKNWHQKGEPTNSNMTTSHGHKRGISDSTTPVSNVK